MVRAMFGAREKCRFALDGAIPALTPHTTGLTYPCTCVRWHLSRLPSSVLIHLSLEPLQRLDRSTFGLPLSHKQLIRHRLNAKLEPRATPPLDFHQVRTADAQQSPWPERAPSRPRPLERLLSRSISTATTFHLRPRRVRRAMAGSMPL
jgi:hypothetical protein